MRSCRDAEATRDSEHGKCVRGMEGGKRLTVGCDANSVVTSLEEEDGELNKNMREYFKAREREWAGVGDVLPVTFLLCFTVA